MALHHLVFILLLEVLVFFHRLEMLVALRSHLGVLVALYHYLEVLVASHLPEMLAFLLLEAVVLYRYLELLVVLLLLVCFH